MRDRQADGCGVVLTSWIVLHQSKALDLGCVIAILDKDVEAFDNATVDECSDMPPVESLLALSDVIDKTLKVSLASSLLATYNKSQDTYVAKAVALQSRVEDFD